MFNAPHFQSHDEARKYLESLRWAGEPICAHCGTVGGHYATKRAGVWRCHSAGCRKDFSVTTKTVMESSHIKLHIWLQAFALMTASKKGMSAHQIHRSLKITYKSAWFLCHRIREAMRTGGLAPMGGGGKVVEADETYIGRIAGMPKGRGPTHKNMVLTLVERGGSARSFHLDGKAISDVMPIIRENVARESRINTDEAKHYYDVAKEYAGHDTVNHSIEEYARTEGDQLISTNTVEGYYSIFKRGMKGVYQHCSEKHLHRYLAEYDFRYSNRAALGVNDGDRAALAVKGAAGKRLTYRLPH
jgi:transposase-like protein